MKLLISLAALALGQDYNPDCSTPDAGYRCQNRCLLLHADCVNSCAPSSPNCAADCNRDVAACEAECPCTSTGNCPEGCPCDFPNENCSTEVDMLVITPGYYNGPPARDVLGRSKAGPIEQHLLHWSGIHRSTALEFSPPITQKQETMCGVVVKGQFHLFGGDKYNPNDAFRLNGCRMQRIISLQFDFDHGICKSIKNGQEALLCSPHSATKDCWTYDGTLMRPTLKLKKAHEKGALVDAYGKVLAVAGPNIDVEELTDRSWALVGDMKGAFPAGRKYQEFTLESIANRVLAFGGFEGGGHDESHFVYQMDLETYEWSRFRKHVVYSTSLIDVLAEILLKPRAKHRSVVIGPNIMLVGGETPTLGTKNDPSPGDLLWSPVEQWTWNGENFDRSLGIYNDVPKESFSLKKTLNLDLFRFYKM